jgi:hypothetical protein
MCTRLAASPYLAEWSVLAMKQVYYTTSLAPSSSPGAAAAAWQVRAASSGVWPERQQSLLPLARYAPPPAEEGQPIPPPPVRLALLQTPETGRFLIHSNYVAGDGSNGQSGTAISHAVLELLPMMDAQHAIQTWGSEFWQQSDPGTVFELPDTLYLPISGRIDDASLTSFLTVPDHKDLLQFLIAAYMTTPPSTRIFLAAPAEDVAHAIYGLTRAIPLPPLENLTFSTYEANPLEANARVIGTSWGNMRTKDLPAACYDGLGVGFNAYSGTKTAMNTSLSFVDFAVQSLATGKTTALDEFRSNWQRLGVKDIAMLDLVYRMARGTGTLTKEESHQALVDPALASWIAARPDALNQFLEWAYDDLEYATGTFPRALQGIRQKPEVMQKLGQAVHEQGMNALKQGKLNRTRNALEVLLPMVAPSKAANVWTEIMQSTQDPDALPWETRGYLLPKFARLKPNAAAQVSDADVQRWIRIPAEKLDDFLRLDVPPAYRLAAVLHCLEGPTPSLGVVAKALVNHAPLVLVLLAKLAPQPGGEAKAGNLFDAVLVESAFRNWPEDLVQAGRYLPGSLFDRVMMASLKECQVNVLTIVRDRGTELLELLSGKPSLDVIADRLLQINGDELLADPAVVRFLEGLMSQTHIRADVRERLEAVLTVRDYLRDPSLEEDRLYKASGALALEPAVFPPTMFDRVRDAAIVKLAHATGDVQSDTETLLLTLAPRSQGGATQLYRDVLHKLLEKKHFAKNLELLHAFLAIAMDATKSPDLPVQLGDLDGEAFALLKQTRKETPKFLDALDGRAMNWPRHARQQWHFVKEAVRPPARGWGRDFGMVFGTIVVCAIAVAVLKFMQIL